MAWPFEVGWREKDKELSRRKGKIVVLVGCMRNPNYRAYRRGRDDEPGGIGTVTIRFPSAGGEILAP